jgi:hypothetical protein
VRYRKKPVEILAWQLRDLHDDEKTRPVPAFIVKAVSKGSIVQQEDRSMIIKTLEGSMVASLGDWIIQGVKGELYPCKPDIFEATYEQVT